MAEKVIGVVGGVGSYAGIDLIKKIYDNTDAITDQEHLTISLLSAPQLIEDRTKFIIGESDVNPGHAIAEVIKSLISHDATVIGIPCNTAHSEEIFSVIKRDIPANIVIVNMIEEVGKYILDKYRGIKKVGVLCTTGTVVSKVYSKTFKQFDLEVVYPSEDIQDMFIQPAIYDEEYGIKAHSNPVKENARENLMAGLSYLIRKKAEVIILGCTEIPLAIPEQAYKGISLVDSTNILARALINLACPEKLKK